MIWNIVDSRTKPFRWKCVDAIIEALEHDNSRDDADQAAEADVRLIVDYDRREGLSIAEAVTWANNQRCQVTLYIYDEGHGRTQQRHFDAMTARW